jgi:signal transduction histidine kinase/ActR/RegA family two-component response regulator
MAVTRPPGPSGDQPSSAGDPPLAAGPAPGGHLPRLAAALLRAPAALLALAREGQPPAFTWHRSAGATAGEEPPALPFCRLVLESGKVTAVADVRESAALGGGAAGPGLVAWLAAPLLGPDGKAFGCLAVAAAEPRAWTEDEAALLADLAQLAEAPQVAPARPSEEATLLKDLPHACFVLDRQWRFTYLNPRAEQLLGLLTGRRAAQLLGQDVWRECPEVADSTFSRECQQALAEQRPLEAETFYPALNRWFAVRVSPAPERLCVFLQDVSERTALERALRQRVEELAEADRGKDEFLVQLAHDVRNGLVPVRNALHLLRGPRGPEGEAEAEQALTLAGQEVQRLSRLLEDLLKVSQLAPGRARPARQRLNLGELVSRCLAAQLPAVTAKGRRLGLHVPPAPVWVEADPEHLEQALGHLLANAVKFTAPGGQVEVTLGREDGAAVLQVQDDGVGMAAEVLPTVFDLFMRPDRGLSRLGGGLGVGLTLVRRLVELNGGTVEAHSDGPGQGSTFTVRLPAAAEAAPVRGPAGVPPPKGPVVGRRIDVLVVDDSLEAAQSLVLVLNRWGCQARVAYDGPGALAEVRARRPDAVFLDIGMPGMDGYEVAQRLRAAEGGDRLLLVAVTGYGQDEDRQRAREAGFDYHLVKPVDPEHLQALLELARPADAGA